MKITSIKIQNFRSFEEETICFDDYTCLVGTNGSGKSTVLTALNVFFRETENTATDMLKLSKEDFHSCNIKEPVIITVTFEDLSPEAQKDFKDYFRQDKLIVSAKAIWDENYQGAEVKQYGQRMGIEKFAEYFDIIKSGAKAPEQIEKYKNLQTIFEGLPEAKTIPQRAEALKNYESEHKELCTLLQSEDEFYGVSRAKDRLEKYIQWVYIPAVKDATTEQMEAKNTALGKLLERRVHSQINLDEPINKLKKETQSKYQELINSNKTSLNALSDSLKNKLRQWSHQNAGLNLDWQDTDKAVNISEPVAEIKASEGPFKGEIARFGHGLQRSFIFALLQELAEHGQAGPKLLLACEEPELYQHPPQARYLASLLQSLSKKDSQIIVCTHSPYFITGKSFENIRVFDKNYTTSTTKVYQTNFEDVANTISSITGDKPTKPGDIAAKVEQDMHGQMNEMFFACVRIFVEGIEDTAYISSYLSLMDKMEEFRGLGCHIIQVQGKSHLIYAVAIAKHLHLPSFTIFDSDGDTPPEKTSDINKHTKDNTAIMKLHDITEPEPFPKDNIWNENLVIWKTKIGDVIEQEIGKDELNKLACLVKKKYAIATGDMQKNSYFIGYLMSEAWEQGKKSQTLIKLCKKIINFAKSIQKISEAESSTSPSTTIEEKIKNIQLPSEEVKPF